MSPSILSSNFRIFLGGSRGLSYSTQISRPKRRISDGPTGKSAPFERPWGAGVRYWANAGEWALTLIRFKDAGCVLIWFLWLLSLAYPARENSLSE